MSFSTSPGPKDNYLSFLTQTRSPVRSILNRYLPLVPLFPSFCRDTLNSLTPVPPQKGSLPCGPTSLGRPGTCTLLSRFRQSGSPLDVQPFSDTDSTYLSRTTGETVLRPTAFDVDPSPCLTPPPASSVVTLLRPSLRFSDPDKAGLSGVWKPFRVRKRRSQRSRRFGAST